MTEQEYRSWITEQKTDDYSVRSEGNTVFLETDYAEGKIVFHDQEIVELVITDRKSEETCFYLHFQLKDDKHAEDLFNEMVGTLMKLKTKQNFRILLSCTSALTTSYFAMELNRAAADLKLDYEFSAVSFNHIYEKGFDYDMILLAPQIHYEYEKAKEIFRNQTVLKIPASVFASYSTGGMIEMIISARAEKNAQKKEEMQKKDPAAAAENNYRILTLGMINHKDMYRFAYRIYDHGKRTLDKEIIKENFSEGDLEDFMDYIVARHHNIDLIGLAMPGVTNQGFLNIPEYGFFNKNVGMNLSKKYGIPVILLNDVNAIAMGYHAMHPDDNDMVFYFQPKGAYQAGAGVIIDGKLRRGFMHNAGEMASVIEADVSDPEAKALTPEGAMEIVCRGLLAYICTMAPEKIVLYSDLTPNTDEIRNHLAAYIDPEYIPEIEHVYSLKSYMMPGVMQRCLEVMVSNNEWIREVKKNAG